MASTFTDLGIEKMATGENAGTWGDKTNTNLEIVEKAISGYVEKAVTSGGTTALTITDGDSTESTSVARHAVIKLTGTISGNSIVTVPDSIEKVYIVTNGTSGGFTVQFKTASGSGITFGVSEKTTKLVYSDGTNIVDAGFGGALDIEGRELVLDADGDTTITADTDDQIDIKIAGADDFQFTANTFTAQSGSTIAAQALTATTVTASGIVKTDNTTEATSTTDGSLQTDGGLSVAKDTVLGDDLKLLSDSAVLSFGADSDTTLTHTDGTGLTLNGANKLLFRDTGLTIGSNADGDLDIVSDGTAADSINIESAGGITLDAGTAGTGIVYEDDGTAMMDITNSSSDVIITTKVSDKDLLIKGNDGGSAVTALTFDMSAAGKATFNSDVVVGGDLTVSGDDITMGTNTAGNLLVADGTNFNSIAVSSLSEISTAASDDVLLAIDTSGGGLKKIARSTVVAGLATDSAIANIVEDTSPQLGGNLDTNSQNILIDDAHFIADENGNEQIIFQTTSSAVNQFDVTNAASGSGPKLEVTGGDSNIDLNIEAKGTGHVTVRGNTNSGAVQFNCESNSHGQIVIAQPHSAAVTNTLTLPAGASSTLVSLVSTDTLTNKTLTSPKINENVAVTSTATEINVLDGITAVVGELNALDIGSTAVGTAVASKAVILDSNKDYTGFRNITLSGELDAGSLDVSGDADIDGTLEADAITIGGTAIASVLSPVAGGSSIVTTGALDSGSITSGFGAIDNGTSNIRSATITAETAFVPDASGGADLGTTALEFNDAFFNDGAVINFGDDQDTTLTHTDGTGLTLNSTNKLCFNDATQFIQGASGTVLDIAATDEIELTATLIDVVGNLAASGTLAQAGVATFAVAANVAQVALTSSSNAIAWDASAAANAFHLTTENTTFSAPSNAVEGAFIAVEINYNGSHTIAFNTVFEFAASTAPTTTDTDGKTDILVFRYNGAVWQEVGRTLNLSES